jgi:hypothetical protein
MTASGSSVMNVKIICFAIAGALLGCVAGIVSGILFIFIFGPGFGRLLGLDHDILHIVGYAVPAFMVIGFLMGGYYGAWVAVWTTGYAMRDYGRRIWRFLSD